MFPWRESGAPSPGQLGSKAKPPAERCHRNPSSRHMLSRPTRVCAAGKESSGTERSARARRFPSFAPRYGHSAPAVDFWQVYRSKHTPKMGEGEQMQKVRRPRHGTSLLRELHRAGCGDGFSEGALTAPCLDDSRNWGFETCLRLSNSLLIKSQMLKGIKRHEKCC